MNEVKWTSLPSRNFVRTFYLKCVIKKCKRSDMMVKIDFSEKYSSPTHIVACLCNTAGTSCVIAVVRLSFCFPQVPGE